MIGSLQFEEEWQQDHLFSTATGSPATGRLHEGDSFPQLGRLRAAAIGAGSLDYETAPKGRAVSEPIVVEVHEFPDVIVLRVKGEVDLFTAPMLRKAMMSAISSRRHVVVSVRDVQHMALAGFHVLKDGQSAVIGAQRIALVASPPHVERVIQIIRFDKVVPTFRSEADALGFVRGENTP